MAWVFGKIKRNEKVIPKHKVSFSDVNSFRSFFSKKRMELLSIIKHKKPKSVYQLAKFANREYKNVYDDVELLERLGLIFKEENNVNVDFDKLSVEIAV